MDKITDIKDLNIYVMPEPALAIVPLKITNSEPAVPIVKLKQIVKKGECIAKAKDENGVDVFSPILGKVVGFDMYSLSNRQQSYCIFIENLRNQNKKSNDSILNAKLQAMKKSLKSDCQNKFDFDENKLNSENNNENIQNDDNACENMQYNGENWKDTIHNSHITENNSDKSQELNKMLGSKNSVVNFDDVDMFNAKNEHYKNQDKENGINENLPNLDSIQDFTFEPFNDGDDLLEHIKKCGVITQNGISLKNELQKDNIVLIPCFDSKNYAYENTSVLIKHFEDIYNAVKVICEKLNKQAIFLHYKDDDLPDINNIWNGQSESGIYKLAVNSVESKRVLKKYFNIIDISNSHLDYGVLNNHFIVLSPVCLLNAYKSIFKGIPHYSTYVTVGGKGLQKGGVYQISSGCTLEHIQNALGGTHSEQDIEDDKTDAMDAIGDYFEAKQAFKDEVDASKKLELKLVMKEKKKIAKKMAVRYIKTVKKKVKTCLGQIAFDDLDFGDTHGNFQAVLELKNRRIYYLSVSQC